jgi:type I restriction enzyme R subunit
VLRLGFFQAVKAMVLKSSVERGGQSQDDVETAIRRVVSKAIVAEGVIDVFEAAGLKKPEISILSDEFLADVRGLQQKHLAVELLQKLLVVRAKLRTLVRRKLRQHGYPPDKAEKAVETVMKQAELLAATWAT